MGDNTRLDSVTYFRPGSCGGKICLKFSDKKFKCSALTVRNFFGGNFIKIMKTYVNGNTLNAFSLAKMASRCIGSIAQNLQGENVLLLDTLKLTDFQGVAHRHFDVA